MAETQAQATQFGDPALDRLDKVSDYDAVFVENCHVCVYPHTQTVKRGGRGQGVVVLVVGI